MSHRIEVSTQGEPLQVPDNANLRESLMRGGIELYSGLARYRHCGGHGRCGTCRVVMDTASTRLSPPTPFEKTLLQERDLACGVRLACQTMVRGDIRVRPEVGSP